MGIKVDKEPTQKLPYTTGSIGYTMKWKNLFKPMRYIRKENQDK